MKKFALLVFLVIACKADEYLVTRRQPLLLEEHKERPDHQKFFIQVFSKSGTNWVTFEKADKLLTIHDLKDVPDGPAILVVESIFSDGEKSEAAAFDINIRRTRPAPPAIKSIKVDDTEAKAKTFDDLMFIRRRERAARYPAPAPAGAVVVVEHPTPPPAIPDGTNRPYSNLLRRNE